MKEIKLYNRDGDDVRLVPVHRNEYLLKCNTSYLRVGNMVGDWNCFVADFVDPPGGPFIEIGNTWLIKNKRVINIRRFDGDIHIYFSKIENNGIQ